MADRLGDRPVGLAAGQGEGLLGKRVDDLDQRRRTSASSWATQGVGRAGSGPAADRAPDADALPGFDVAPGGDDVGRGRLELRDPVAHEPSVPRPVSGGRSPSRVASGRPRSRHIAAIPTAGPSARSTQATRQPPASVGSRRPTPRIVTPVRTKPPASWRDSAEPAVPGGASSEIAAENWAESATTVRPQIERDGRDHGRCRAEQEPDDERGPAAAGHRRDRQRGPPVAVGQGPGDDAADATARDDDEGGQRGARRVAGAGGDERAGEEEPAPRSTSRTAPTCGRDSRGSPAGPTAREAPGRRPPG